MSILQTELLPARSNFRFCAAGDDDITYWPDIFGDTDIHCIRDFALRGRPIIYATPPLEKCHATSPARNAHSGRNGPPRPMRVIAIDADDAFMRNWRLPPPAARVISYLDNLPLDARMLARAERPGHIV